jgi:hypothetical protein
MDAKSLREAMKSKAKRLAGASSDKVDSSTFTPPELLNADVKTGMRPISRRAYKSGGKVEGEEHKGNASRVPRGDIGLANTNQRVANEEREGKKHVGGFKKGGRIPKYIGGSAADRVEVMPPTEAPVSKYIAKRKDGGRTAKMDGGMMTSPRPKARPEDLAMRQKMESINRSANNADGQTGTGASPAGSMRPMRRPSAEEMKGQAMLDSAARSGDGYKKGGMVEGSAKDKAEDKKLAKKHGMSMKEWEKSPEDKAHDKGCTCKACGGAAMGKKDGGGLYANIHAKRERIKGGSGEKMRKPGSKGAPTSDAFKASERTARKSGGKVGKTNINIIISPHHDGKLGSMGPMQGAEAGIPKPPMPAPSPAPMPAAAPPAHMALPPGLGAALAGAAGAGPAGPAGAPAPGGMPMRPPMPGPMMARKSGGRVDYPITTGSGGGNARKEKVAAYGEKMNKDLKK